MANKKSYLSVQFLFVLCGLLIFPLSSQGCAMSEMNNTEMQLIHQILLKAKAKIPLTEQGELSVEYLDYLRQALSTEPGLDEPDESGERVVPDESIVPDAKIALSYMRPMSGGVHVLRLEPALQREAILTLTATLSDLADVEYAEPDFPRSRR